jgi:hypothetical protein
VPRFLQAHLLRSRRPGTVECASAIDSLDSRTITSRLTNAGSETSDVVSEKKCVRPRPESVLRFLSLRGN